MSQIVFSFTQPSPPTFIETILSTQRDEGAGVDSYVQHNSPEQPFISDESTLTSPPSTPRQREQEVTYISEEVKARVDLATSALTGSRCLIENADDDCTD